MAQAKTLVAFDVHVSGVVAAVIDRESGELRVSGCRGGASEVAAFVAGLPGPVRATYEAGPTGFVLARRLAGGRGGLSGVRAGADPARADPIASRPIGATRSGWCGCWWRVSCIAVAVPSVEAEASARSGARARGSARRSDARAPSAGEAAVASRRALRRAAAQLDAGRICGWLAGGALRAAGTQAAFEDYRGAVEALMIRREQLEAEIAERCRSRRGRRPRGG